MTTDSMNTEALYYALEIDDRGELPMTLNDVYWAVAEIYDVIKCMALLLDNIRRDDDADSVVVFLRLGLNHLEKITNRLHPTRSKDGHNFMVNYGTEKPTLQTHEEWLVEAQADYQKNEAGRKENRKKLDKLAK